MDASTHTETEFVLIKDSGIHGTGGFARKDIPSGTEVIEYVGLKIDKAEAERQCESDNEYIFILDDQWDLNGNVPWNPARFINHSCAPNCEAEVDEDEGRVRILALRDISAGEELSFNYGYDLEDYKDHICHCGAGICTGYIVAEEHFHTLKELQSAPCE